MRSIKFGLIRRQRPRQFSYDCWGFDFSGVLSCHVRVSFFSKARWNLTRTSPRSYFLKSRNVQAF